MAKYEKYAEYQDSGVEWLGEIPSHWEVSKFAYVINTVGDIDHYMPDSVDIGIPYIMTGDLQESVSEIDLTKCKQVSQEAFQRLSKKIKTSKDDVILARYATIGTASYVDIDADFLVSYSCVTIKPKRSKTTGKYLFCYLKSHAFLQAIQMQVNSNTQGNVGVDSLRAVKVIMPPLEEQNFIINFLDHETAQIDTLIAKQEKLIELLKEKRQAVISHAVTKGLNPDVAMKDSGVEWLGQVPEHWVTLPLKLCVETRKGVAFKAVDFCDFGIRVVKASDIKQKTIRESDIFLPEKYLTEYPKAILREGDLVLSTVGSTPDVKNSAVGQIGKVPKKLNNSLLNQNTVIFSAKKNLDQNFLFYVVQADSYRDHLDLHAHGTANQASLNIENMLDFKISIPDLKEQKEITSYLDKKMSEYEKLELHSLEIINLMIKRRTALISSVVTGKIDVRNWQAPHKNNEANTEKVA